ncbi:MAG: hypothetical protein A2147_03245 [Chloroflexi bacterium RBG_16_57_8]|nr:MAG: hypothetical protein A2147_03245 [Chloroflexi bacterium RBG_16_57_8]
METIIVSIVSMALIIVSTLTVTVSTFQSANRLADAWKNMEERSGVVRQTDINTLAPEDYQGGQIILTVQNEGNVNLNDFSSWDVIVQYQSGGSVYVAFTTSYPPEVGRWAVEGIYVAGGSPEVFDPGILNPGERMTVSISPTPEIGPGEMARIIVSTPGGVTSQCYVTRE